MKEAEYKRICRDLGGPADIERLAQEGYDARLLETVLTQKTIRHIRRKGYLLKKQGQMMYDQWFAGRSFVEIADRLGFPPVLVALEIFSVNGTPRKVFWEYAKDPSKLRSPDTAAELREACEADFVFSPAGEERSKERGLWGEGLLWDWLDSQNVGYTTESDRKNRGSKTPDCLLDEPMLLGGKRINWIESKASFGDRQEFSFNLRKQLLPYTELFGPGAVVYWTGHLDELEAPEGICLCDIGILDDRLRKARTGGRPFPDPGARGTGSSHRGFATEGHSERSSPIVAMRSA